MTDIEIDRADSTDIEWLGHLIAEAFHDLPPTQWLIPDLTDRARIMPCYFEILLDHGIQNGAVYTTIDRTAAAIWIPTAPGFTRVLPDYHDRLAAVTGTYHDRFKAFDKALEERHPTSAAHHHLAILAVAPHRQNSGIGSALLRRYQAILDRDKLPAYLEAANPRTRDFYHRHGFGNLGHALTLPDGPLVYPMWRPARPSGAASSRGGPSRQSA